MTNQITLTDKEFAIVRQCIKRELENSRSAIVQDICRALLKNQLTTAVNDAPSAQDTATFMKGITN